MGIFHIVDDETFISEFVAELISSLGFKSKGFSCPAEYLDYMKTPDYQRPIAIFTDVRMPKMTGFDMIERIREFHPDQKFVVMSGYSMGVEVLNKQACQYIAKPFRPEVIEQTALSLAKCHKQVSPNIKQCQGNISAEYLDVWRCPLDCSDC
ncbi:two-component system, response regulator YesN [Mariprofundus aestuarium]|uniref:Two-component system, response regulator YesN n=1 Tax=Mariprofundus aestuarium TaxID=1921086 RepID=A0A2K8KXN4_MARES|nr:response regulator [Mariprofundus aestuarium]ATX79730.1 two-component system, response regulator YesN [Mariprofundus aestuarium]